MSENNPKHYPTNPIRIKTIGLMINEVIDNSKSNLLRIDFNHDFSLVSEQNLAYLDLEVMYFLPDENNGDIKVLGCLVQNVFKLSNMQQLLNEDGFVVLPNSQFIDMVSMAISHTRAILSVHTAGTQFQDTLLPTLNPVNVAIAFADSMKKRNQSEQVIIAER